MRCVIRRSRTRKTTGITNTRQISTTGTSSQKTLAVGEIRSRSCEAASPGAGPRSRRTARPRRPAAHQPAILVPDPDRHEAHREHGRLELGGLRRIDLHRQADAVGIRVLDLRDDPCDRVGHDGDVSLCPLLPRQAPAHVGVDDLVGPFRMVARDSRHDELPRDGADGDPLGLCHVCGFGATKMSALLPEKVSMFSAVFQKNAAHTASTAMTTTTAAIRSRRRRARYDI